MTEDKSLLKCTIRKSISVAERLVVYAAYLIVGVTIGTVAWVGIPYLWNTIITIWNELGIPAFVMSVYSMLVSISPLVYAAISIPIGIIGYSLLWCINRELTTDDYTSDSAFVVAIVFAIAAVAVAAIAAVAVAAFVFAAFAAIVVAIVVEIVFAAADNPEGAAPVGFLWYAFRFFGAWYHHWRNNK